MRNFFIFFAACLLALVVFFVGWLLIVFGIVGAVTSTADPTVKANSVLVFDISQPITEQTVENTIEWNSIAEKTMGVYEVVKGIHYAAASKEVKGILLVGGDNPNGFATSNEVRNALLQFKKSGKFIVAYANHYAQRGYDLATVAEKIVVNPAGSVDWMGFSYQTIFINNLLTKLAIKPEIFYAGKYKSATEAFRLSKMSEANREQVASFANNLYADFLNNTGKARKLDTALLHSLANSLSIGNANDALRVGLVDEVGYDDQLRKWIADKTGTKKTSKLTTVTIGELADAAKAKETTDGDKIAILYANGDIVDGPSDEDVSGEQFRKLIATVREDESIKAVVLRVNSPGGSALASEVIHRELSLLKQEKPLVVSMGNLAASGGYYISCMADSIFAQPGTLTGSIGVFSMLFDASTFFAQKIGITYDEVSTSPSASVGNPMRPLQEVEKQFMQRSVDTIYERFKNRVAAGRKISVAYVDSIGQGRVWTGNIAVKNKLVDRVGGIEEAIASAAKLAKLKTYYTRSYPEVKPFWEKIMDNKSSQYTQTSLAIERHLGTEMLNIWKYYHQLKQQNRTPQMRLPFYVPQ